jgi:hypothetical protein
MPTYEPFSKASLALAAATLLMGASEGTDALFASEAQVFRAVGELGPAWRVRPTLVRNPVPRPPVFMPYILGEGRSVFIHRDGNGHINRVVLGDNGCWAEGREKALRTVLRMSRARPEALHNLKFGAALAFDADTKIQGVQAAPRLIISFQRSNRKAACGIDMTRTVSAAI